jgi:hypothetical protein
MKSKRKLRITESQLRLIIKLIKENQNEVNEDLNEDDLTEVEKDEEELGFLGKALRGAFGVNFDGEEYRYPDAGGPTI